MQESQASLVPKTSSRDVDDSVALVLQDLLSKLVVPIVVEVGRYRNDWTPQRSSYQARNGRLANWDVNMSAFL